MVHSGMTNRFLCSQHEDEWRHPCSETLKKKQNDSSQISKLHKYRQWRWATETQARRAAMENCFCCTSLFRAPIAQEAAPIQSYQGSFNSAVIFIYTIMLKNKRETGEQTKRKIKTMNRKAMLRGTKVSNDLNQTYKFLWQKFNNDLRPILWNFVARPSLPDNIGTIRPNKLSKIYRYFT